MKKSVCLCLAFMILLSCGCSPNAASVNTENKNKSSRSVFAMNTYITLTAYGNNAKPALTAAENKLYELEQLWSVTDESSEIYGLNHSNGKPCRVSKETADIIAFSLDMAQKTNGVLDPTVYPVLTAWGFTTENYHIPSDEERIAALGKIGYTKVSLDGQVISVPNGTQLDLGAIAKGYTGDVLVKQLKEQGVCSALLNLGGNVQTIGAKPDGSKWRIGLRGPDSEKNIGVLLVENKAVITSGNYQKYFVGKDGKRYHHIIDTATGKPAESGLVSATVIGKEGKLCDALSTALFIMGAEHATAYWRENNHFDMILLTDDNKLFITEGIATDFTLNAEYASYEMEVVTQ